MVLLESINYLVEFGGCKLQVMLVYNFIDQTVNWTLRNAGMHILQIDHISLL